ncbi:hypothetical protein VTJ83DRAFT_4810 [Remersonia thermophila]|uniref:Protein kinase domain-containing protein n=1 Tax=Remersonia thermophila TaxID=72144 RepID=A0ABR4DAZ8_9PEZI
MSQPLTDASVAAGALSSPTDNSAQMAGLWRRWFGDKDGRPDGSVDDTPRGPRDEGQSGAMRRTSRRVVTGLPRTQTFQRQRSEVREKLEPVLPTPVERRAVSMDRRVHGSHLAIDHSDPRSSAPDFLHHSFTSPSSPSCPMSPSEEFLRSTDDLASFRDSFGAAMPWDPDSFSLVDVRSMTTSQYGAQIERELETRWILNLSMHFRDKSKREKFFVTFRQHKHVWRRVTVSLDYRDAPEPSLEADLCKTTYQRDKSAKIYDAIRDSLSEIEFFDTVTNLRLETRDGRLHVHVVEDANEIISYPPVSMVQHVNCRRFRESEVDFVSHMSGFVYQVRVYGKLLIKKEIPGPENVDEFLYEINALSQLCEAENVIYFYGIVVDDSCKKVTGLLISYASRGALIDLIYDGNHNIPWPVREKWARQIVGGLAEIHEAGFVQGDFTLSNIVVDANDNAKIIDINRRGCPIGWEPPEVTPLISSNQRISMYIGVKSDLYQLGMVLWALATQEDEPDRFQRPLVIDPNLDDVPQWYRRVVATCLSPDPRDRVHAIDLLSWFPEPPGHGSRHLIPNGPSTSVNSDDVVRDGCRPPKPFQRIRSSHPANDWARGPGSHLYPPEDMFHDPSRGRSPPSPMPSDHGNLDGSRFPPQMYPWSDTAPRVPPAPSISDVLAAQARGTSMPRLQGSGETLETYADGSYRAKGATTEDSRDDTSLIERDQSFLTTDDYYARAQELRKSSTWGPPPNRWQSESRQVIRYEPAGHGHTSHRKGSGDVKGTSREYRADSGKDFTDVASTPRGSWASRSRYSPAPRDRSVSRGRRGRSSAHVGEQRCGSESRSRSGESRTADVSTPSPRPQNCGYNDRSSPKRVHDSNDWRKSPQAHDDSQERTRPIPASRMAHSYRRSDEDLKGVGSVHESGPPIPLSTPGPRRTSPHRSTTDDNDLVLGGKRATPDIDIDLDLELDEKMAMYSPPQRAELAVDA